ncbi:MAG: protein kinase domain-containing protein [Gemmatimonadota bacterium]
MSTDAAHLTRSLTGRYRVDRELGAGGMATVFLAHDVRHGRRVALKLLRPELAAVIGAERFLNEIKTTANLQHPHILPLFDSGEVDGTVFYVMPYIEGESLRERLNRETQLPVDEAVRIAREVADALDYAHRHGVVHRDIKPENVLLNDGRAIVADFGIALAVSRSDGASRMTETGMSLGTPHYMSPEQAMGEREITARSDVYALGCIAYEMLVGEPPFTGPTAQAIVARVVTESPRSLAGQRPTIPPHVDAAVRRALEKLPADRFQTASQFASALITPGVASATTHAMHQPPRGGLMRIIRNPWWSWGTAMVLMVAAIALATRGVLDQGAVPTIRFDVTLDQVQSFSGTAGVVVTPDGRTVITRAIVGQRAVLVARQLDSLQSTIIEGTIGADRQFLSPDGTFVGFSSNGKLMKVPVTGGAPIAFGESSWGGGAWNRDGRVVFSKSYQSGLWLVNEAGGPERKLTDPDTTKGELAHWWPCWLSDGKSVLFTAFRTPMSKATIEVLNIETGVRKVLLEGGVMARLLPTGHLLFARDESVLAVGFDVGKLEVVGSPIVVIEDVQMNFSDGQASWDAAPNGLMAYIRASSSGSRVSVVEVDRRGAERPVIETPDRYAEPRWAPDGRRISVTYAAPRSANDVWVHDPVRGSRVRITAEEAADFGAVWTPDGRELIYMSERPLFELYRRTSDASRPSAPFLGARHDRSTGSVSPDGVLSFVLSVPGASEIWTTPVNAPDRGARYLANGFNIGHPSLSPDGKWMAYDSPESGRLEVFIQSYPDPTRERVQVSSSGGSEPWWTKGGRELAFRRGDSVLVVSIDPVSGAVGRPLALFGGRYVTREDWVLPASYDVTPDGERFLMLKLAAGDERRRVNVVTNWFAEVRRKVQR